MQLKTPVWVFKALKTLKSVSVKQTSLACDTATAGSELTSDECSIGSKYLYFIVSSIPLPSR